MTGHAHVSTVYKKCDKGSKYKPHESNMIVYVHWEETGRDGVHMVKRQGWLCPGCVKFLNAYPEKQPQRQARRYSEREYEE